MARSLRIEYSGAVYHVMAWGNQGQKICADDGDRKMWLASLREHGSGLDGAFMPGR